MGYNESMDILQLVSSDGDIDLIRLRIASAGADELNAVSKKKGNTPLHLAAIKGRTDIIALLLDAGATIEPKNTDGNTPLLVAMLNEHKDCVQLLLQAGADCAHWRAGDLSGSTPIHFAARWGDHAMLSLLAKNADVNASDSSGNTPLYYAAINGHASCLAFLRDAGATVPSDIKHLIAKHEKDARTILQLAKAGELGGDTGLLEEALGDAGMNLKLADKAGNTALHQVLKQYRSSGMVSTLVWMGADVNARNSDGETPLLAAARQGDADIAQLLLRYGADVNALDKNHVSPLHMAARQGDSAIVKPLLDHGADVNALDKNHVSPLHMAAARQYANADIVQLLLRYGADVNALDKNHVSPLHMAARQGDSAIVKPLLDHGADVNALDKNRVSPLHMAAARQYATTIVQLLLDHGADVNALDKNHVSPLHMAARQGDSAIVKPLLDHGADVNALDKNHVSPLHMAAARQYANADIVQLLLRYGADVNALDKNHVSPLIVAVAENNLDCTRMLLPLTSETIINAHDGEGRTPLSITAGRGDDETVKLLLNAGADPNNPPSPETQTLENPLKAAISNYRVTTAKLLLQSGSHPGGPAYDALAGFYKDFGANTTYQNERGLLPERRELLEFMLQLGMDPSHTISQQESACGDTLLHVLCRHDAPIEDIQMLLVDDRKHDRGTINTKNADGDTPLASHIGGEELRIGVVRTLLEYGADAAVINNEGLSLLSLLDKRPEVEVTDSVREALIDNGADEPSHSRSPQSAQALPGAAPAPLM